MNDSAGVGRLRWLAKTAEETEAFGARLAGARPRLGELGTIYLSGELGAGKTTLARGFLRAMGITGSVRSPTYTLVEVYETTGVSVVHLDLYRLTDESELEPLGLREWARSGYLWLVEWPDRAQGHLPRPDLSVVMEAGEMAHAINVTATSALGQSWLSAVENTAAAP